MSRIYGIRHKPMWETGWRPPERFVARCPAGVECHIDHKVEWDYAEKLKQNWSKRP